MFLYLTTTGRRTGLAREIEIWFTERGRRFYLIAEHGEGANWVRNVQANPRVTVRVVTGGSPELRVSSWTNAIRNSRATSRRYRRRSTGGVMD